MYHPKRVSQWKEKGDCYPIHIELGLTSRCNHRCVFCGLDFLEYQGESIDREVMMKALKDMGEKEVKSILIAGEGEPFLHPNISEFVQYAKQNGIDMSIETNGVLFNKEKAEACLPYLTWIRISLDAGTKETYKKIHKGGDNDFEKVIENLKNAVQIKKEKNLNTTIGVQFLLIPDNIEDVFKAAEICKEIGVDYLTIKPYSQHPLSKNKFVIDYKDYAHLQPKLETLNSDSFKILFRKQTMKRLEDREYSKCHGLPFSALIDVKGNIFPCNLYYNKKDFVYGNLNEQSFIEIWEGEQRKQVMKKLHEQGVKDCRHGCRLDVMNRYLYRLENPLPHDNFV